MDLQTLARQTFPTTAFSNPHFNNNILEEKFNNGWFKKDYYGVIIFWVLSLVNFINTFRLAIYYLGNSIPKYTTNSWGNTEYYSTLLHWIPLLVLSALVILSFFWIIPPITSNQTQISWKTVYLYQCFHDFCCCSSWRCCLEYSIRAHHYSYQCCFCNYC